MDFLAEHKPALAVTGAVALPFPFPASARVSVVTPAKEHGLAEHYIKIVQVVGEKQFNTWFVERKDLRAMRVPAPASGGPVHHAGWILQPEDTLKKDIDAAVKKLAPDKGVYEVPLYPKAIALVGESVPVITRHEFVATAGEVGELPHIDVCVHCPPPPPPPG